MDPAAFERRPNDLGTRAGTVVLDASSASAVIHRADATGDARLPLQPMPYRVLDEWLGDEEGVRSAALPAQPGVRRESVAESACSSTR